MSMLEALDDEIPVRELPAEAPRKVLASIRPSSEPAKYKEKTSRLGDMLKYIGGGISALFVVLLLALRVMRFAGPLLGGGASGSQGDEFLALVEETLDISDQLLAVTRQITDVESARRLAPQWADLMEKAATAAEDQKELEGQRLYGAQAKRYERAVARDQEQQRQMQAEMSRIQLIPGVAVPLAEALQERIARDPTGALGGMGRAHGLDIESAQRLRTGGLPPETGPPPVEGGPPPVEAGPPAEPAAAQPQPEQ